MGLFKREDKLKQTSVTSSNRSVNNNNTQRSNNRVDPFTCRYCGQVGFIGSCLFSPVGVHMAIVGSPDKCVYCGSGDYGHTCQFSPERRGPHRHGHDGKHCIYCGLENVFGKTCSFSPDGYHSL